MGRKIGRVVVKRRRIAEGWVNYKKKIGKFTVGFDKTMRAN